MYNEEIMMNDDNLESNLLTSSLLKKMSGLHASTQVELKRMCLGNLTLQVNYAVGRLVAVIVYCFSGDLNLLAITVYMEV